MSGAGQRRRRVRALFSGAALVVSLGAAPLAWTEGEGRTIPAAAFGPDGASQYFFSFGGGDMRTTGDGSACLVAPVYLPDGAVLYELRFYALDDGVLDVSLDLLRKRLTSTEETEILASAATSGQSEEVQVPRYFPILSGGLVDNREYAYFLSTCLSADRDEHRLYGARVVLLPEPASGAASLTALSAILCARLRARRRWRSRVFSARVTAPATGSSSSSRFWRLSSVSCAGLSRADARRWARPRAGDGSLACRR